MAEMGDGYGSECHLLRYLGRHRGALDRQILDLTGSDSIQWLDFPFDRSRTWQDGEWKGLDFLEVGSPARVAWQTIWPQRGNPPNWDAIGKLTTKGVAQWLLVEAKANAEELQSSCKAVEEGGRPLITKTLAATKEHLGVSAERQWLDGYYQYANRVAVLDFLRQCNVPARLLNIYFVGDRGDARRSCPNDIAGWNDVLVPLKAHIGLPSGHPLEDRIHELFLPVCSS
jgi:hypothetical protein